MPGQHVQTSSHTYRHSTGHHDHTKYAWPACSGLFAHLKDTTITQSMPGQHVQASSHTYRTPQSHKVCLPACSGLYTPTGHHNHTKYAWQVCSDLFAHLHTQHRTPQSHKVYLISMFRPLHTHLQAQHRTQQSHKVCLVSMFGPLHTVRHSTRHHNHTKYAWSACLDIFAHRQAQQDITITKSMPCQHVRTSAHCQAQHRTPQSHKVCLVSTF